MINIIRKIFIYKVTYNFIAMKYEELREVLKKIEFHKTEPEVLTKLIDRSIEKGNNAQQELNELKKVGKYVLRTLEKKEFILKNSNINENNIIKTVVGIDGSFQLAGGVGGKWYLFLSAARIVFRNNINPETPEIWADIEEVDESENPNLKLVAEIKMLLAESKFLLNWGDSKVNSLVFVDGPVVDPPFHFENEDKYIADRVEAIENCLRNDSLVVGCVKRVRDKFFIEYIRDKLNIPEIERFPTDQHLMLILFTLIRKKYPYSGSLYTKWISWDDISLALSSTPYPKYKKRGIFLISFFYERDIMSKLLRVDVPLLFSPSENPKIVDDIVSKVINTLDYWTYPGQDPLPVLLAHEKCNIRKGTAEVLYEEVLTRSSGDTFDQIIMSRIR
ncbi:MAG: DNA double-strand break repair nuclease NurA [Thermoproteales archaeon]|nr:DNA double-strand break repair nuclease NurA [Thermoproteales archaeon]